MTYFVLLSHHSVYSVVTAQNLSPVKRDDWNASRVCLSHARPSRTLRRSQSWNKHASSRSGVYYASLHILHSHKTLWTRSRHLFLL